MEKRTIKVTLRSETALLCLDLRIDRKSENGPITPLPWSGSRIAAGRNDGQHETWMSTQLASEATWPGRLTPVGVVAKYASAGVVERDSFSRDHHTTHVLPKNLLQNDTRKGASHGYRATGVCMHGPSHRCMCVRSNGQKTDAKPHNTCIK